MIQLRRHLLLMALLALAVAACGGGDGKADGVASLGGGSGRATATTRAGGNDRQKALNWARCMRQHGINLPDPRFDANGRVVWMAEPPAAGGAAKLKYRAAEQACKQYEISGGPPPSPPSAQQRQQALAFARCMRQHGINNMPDPEITATGMHQHLPEGMNRDDPRLRAPRQACEQYLPPDRRGGK